MVSPVCSRSLCDSEYCESSTKFTLIIWLTYSSAFTFLSSGVSTMLCGPQCWKKSSVNRLNSSHDANIILCIIVSGDGSESEDDDDAEYYRQEVGQEPDPGNTTYRISCTYPVFLLTYFICSYSSHHWVFTCDVSTSHCHSKKCDFPVYF